MKVAGQVYCSRCWARIPQDAPRIVIGGAWCCATCAYEAQMGRTATNVGHCAR